MTGLARAWIIARAELRGGLRDFWLLIACLALGVAAIAALGSARAAIDAGLATNGARILGGDAEITLTGRRATEAERAALARFGRVSEVLDFRSMAVVRRDDRTERALIRVKAVDDAYPLLGTLGTTPDWSRGDGLAIQQGLADRLAVRIGDELSLGTKAFPVTAILDDWPDRAGGGIGFAPVVLVASDALQGSGLIAQGTMYESAYRIALPADTDARQIRPAIEAALSGSGLRWRDASNAAPGLSRAVERLGAFLVLIGLAGLAVGGVGVAGATRAYMASKTHAIATLKSLGAPRGVIFLAYLLQIMVVSLAGIALGLLAGALVTVLAAPIVSTRLALPLQPGLYPAPLAVAAGYGLLTALIFTVWPLGRAEVTPPAVLLRDEPRPAWPRPSRVALIAVAVAALVALALSTSSSVRLVLWTLGGVSMGLLVLALAAVLMASLAVRLGRRLNGWPVLRLALADLAGRRAETVAITLSLGLGLSVLAAVGQVDGTLRGAITRGLPEVAPSYFFVDIQPDQIEGLRDRLSTDPGVTRLEAAPMIRGVLTRINGAPAAEVAGDHWVLRGDRGVTYSAEPPPRTRVVAGQWWPPDYRGPNQISFAAEEAQELGLKLGDAITVNILGRDITGTITSLREVDFETAGIGFVMAFNPAALAGAPHSWIATVYSTAEAEPAIVRDITAAYPNVTAIRVGDAIAQVAELLGGIASAVRWGASVALLSGVLVLIGAAVAGEPARRHQAAILRAIGASRRQVMAAFLLRAAMIGLIAGAIALALGLLSGWAVAKFVLKIDYAVVWPSALVILSSGIAANILAGALLIRRSLGQRPAPALRFDG